MEKQIAFRHDEAARRFIGEVDGVTVAYAEVDPIGAKSLLIKHTEVLPAHEGHGYGSALVRFVLDTARAQGRTVMPICPFAAGYVRRHREYADLVKIVT